MEILVFHHMFHVKHVVFSTHPPELAVPEQEASGSPALAVLIQERMNCLPRSCARSFVSRETSCDALIHFFLLNQGVHPLSHYVVQENVRIKRICFLARVKSPVLKQ